MTLPNGHRDRLIRGMVAAVLALTCAKVWLGDAVGTPAAQAQVFDSAAQRKAILEAIERGNATLIEIRDQLKTGVINVRARSTDNQQGGADASAVGRP